MKVFYLPRFRIVERSEDTLEAQIRGVIFCTICFGTIDLIVQ